KIRVILTANTLTEFAIVARPGITSVQQLKGKLVLISRPQGATATFTRDLLRRGGVAPSSVRFGAIRDSSSRVIALAHGRADAALLEQLDIERLALGGKHYTVLGRLGDFQPPGPPAVWAVSASFL